MSIPTLVIHSMAFMDAMQEILGIDLGKCYKIVITADIETALDVAIYMRGTQQHINGFRVWPRADLVQGVRIIDETNE